MDIVKYERLFRTFKFLCAIGCAALISLTGRAGQPAVVTVTASTPVAIKPGTPGAFTIARTGSANTGLLVFYQVSGTAVPDVDYIAVGQVVTLAPGAASAVVPVVPIGPGLVSSTQTVILTLSASPLAGSQSGYVVGTPSNATVSVVSVAPSNPPPVVTLTSPPDGRVFEAPDAITVSALAGQRGGAVTNVAFLAGTNLLGAVPGATTSGAATSSFSLVWTNPAAGTYALTAVATSSLGGMATSSPVNITIVRQISLPTVTLSAEGAPAAPCGTNPAVAGSFIISRDGNTNVGFLVNYLITGTARNGIDYNMISNAVVIPTGSWSVAIPIAPLAGAARWPVATVELTLVPEICPAIWPPPPDCYRLGSPSSSGLAIQECGPTTNPSPVVRLVSPPNHAMFRSPIDLPIYAYAASPGGTIGTVEILAGSDSLGFARTVTLTNLAGAPRLRPPSGRTCSAWSGPTPRRGPTRSRRRRRMRAG